MNRRRKKKGRPHDCIVTPSPADMERFLAKVRKSHDPDGCWLWTGAKNRQGYGYFWFRGKNLRAHRFLFAAQKGPIVGDDILLHSCHTPQCVNTAHLRIGTWSENLLDQYARGEAEWERWEEQQTEDIRAGQAYERERELLMERRWQDFEVDRVYEREKQLAGWAMVEEALRLEEPVEALVGNTMVI